jgi:hypothetical protein
LHRHRPARLHLSLKRACLPTREGFYGPDQPCLSGPSFREAKSPAHPALQLLREHFGTPANDAPKLSWDACAASEGRYALEYDWLSHVDGLPKAVAATLAARAAASSPGMARAPIPPAAAAFQADDPPSNARADAQSMLVSRLWMLALPVERLLAHGGDERLELDPATWLNKYGCTPFPRPAVIDFASCTASSPSEIGFIAAERARRALIKEAVRTTVHDALTDASAHIARAILDYAGAADLAQAVLTASGTDAAMIATALSAARGLDTDLTSVLVSADETGSGVPDAVRLRHFANHAPGGVPVAQGTTLGGRGARLTCVGLRDRSGIPLDESAIERACEAAIVQALPHGRVVLHTLDSSKTGLAAPGQAALQRLAAQFGDRLDIVVDACQARVAPAVLRWYLTQGCTVLLTGSKFFGAPGFCGALLVPHTRGPLVPPAWLAPYARTQGALAPRLCPGIVLRWSAALQPMAAFAHMNDAVIATRLDQLGASVARAVRDEPRLVLIEAPRAPGTSWSDRRSIFTLAVRGERGLLDAPQLRALLAELRMHGPAGPGCQIGQPVKLGAGGIAGIRIALSAEQVMSSACQTDALATVVTKLGAALESTDKAAEAMAIG